MQADKWMRRCVGRVSDDARFQTFRHTDTDGKASPLTVIPPILIERTTKHAKYVRDELWATDATN